MIFTTIRPVILQVVINAAPSGVSIYWSAQPNRFTNPATRTVIKMSLVSPVSKGMGPERITSYNGAAAAGQEITESIVNPASFVLRLRCECQDETDSGTAEN